MEIEALDMAASRQDILKERKEKIVNYLKKNKAWISYILLALLSYFAFWLRTLNLSGLRDVTTGSYTLGPDLDPFLFLRWAEYIVEHGSLYNIDAMRYVPLGFEAKAELILLSYMIAWFHKIASFFGSTSVSHSAVLFPAFMFVLTIIAFFLFVRKIFIDSLGAKKANAIALISSFFLTVIPSLLPRTIAGIPEKESAAFFFMFLAFYFFISSWKSEKNISRCLFALLSGISTACMALIWGGFIYIFAALSITMLMIFLSRQVDAKKFFIYALWLLSAIALMSPFSTRYSLYNVFTSTITGFSIAVFFILLIHFLLFNTKIKNYFSSPKFANIPPHFISFITSILIGIIFVIITLGPNFIFDNLSGITRTLITPVSSRFGVTVAENAQPFFDGWSSNFGPVLGKIPIFFWLFFLGSISLFYFMLNTFPKKERLILTFSYVIFLICIIFSRYKSDSIFNGTNTASLALYSLGFIVLLGVFGYYYFASHKKGEHAKFKGVDISIVLLFALFFFSLVSARGAIRVILVLVPSASIIASYFLVSLISLALGNKNKDELIKMFAWILAVIVLLSAVYSGYYFYQASKATARSYVPSEYTRQWQYAMSWVRENTPKNAVFAHWWDYGYWVQSIGKRATILDGGNAIVYWDHLMGRHVLTTPDDAKALEFLYTHNATHLLIDSSDIGKYTAFSSIGSDENYENCDRVSWLQSFIKDRKQIVETKNSTLFLYSGGTTLDSDIKAEINGTSVFLPGKKAGIGGFILEKDSSGIKQPKGIYIYQNNRYDLPLRYAYYNGFIDFGSGVEAGIFIFPMLIQDNNGISIEQDGAALYLSNRTVKSLFARLYLYNESSNFKLAHSEDDFIVKRLKENNLNVTDFIYFQGVVRGPIKIWEINYPSDVKINPDYLEKDYPNKELAIQCK